MSGNRPQELMTGNEAIARGAAEAGVGVCTSYPGTPSTEIATEFSRLAEETGALVRWSVNEKVALEIAAGASWMGIPALCSMKSLGLNVASDFLLNVNLSGTGPGGLVIVVCDDPRGHSSSNEQDSRFYARAAYIPLLEPTTAEQAKGCVRLALEVSQRWELPVMIRSTTRLSHTQMPVTLGEVPTVECDARQSIPEGLFNVPVPHLRHKMLLEKIEEVEEMFEKSTFNSTTASPDGTQPFGAIASGVCSLYARDALEARTLTGWQLLSLVTTHPLPTQLVRQFVEGVDTVLVVEAVSYTHLTLPTKA